MYFKLYLEMNMTSAATWLSVGISKADSKKSWRHNEIDIDIKILTWPGTECDGEED